MTTDTISVLIPLGIWALFALVDRIVHMTSRYLAFWACWYGVLAIWNMVDGESAPMAADGAFAGWCAYHAWKRRKPRQRKPSKALGRVRDLGHRLVVSGA